ncbi:hypothetical protein A9Q99_14755 [Gammaproteobacteria bacterium 45_16_T64]|nr:hypothetical protein A9Q99_14755 [Gammaproteobacteria bacterium 45_16_T64]
MDLTTDHIIHALSLPRVDAIPYVPLRFDLSGAKVTATRVAPLQEEQRNLPYCIHYQIDGHAFSVSIDSTLLDQLLANLPSALPLAALPPAIQFALMQTAMAPFIESIEAHTNLAIAVSGFDCVDTVNDTTRNIIEDIPCSDYSTSSKTTTLEFRCVLNNRPCLASLSISSNALPSITTLFSHAQSTPVRIDVNAIPITFSVHLPGLKIGLQELTECRVHDILLLSNSHDQLLQAVELRINYQLIGYGRIEDNAIHITRTTIGSAMETSLDEHHPTDESIDTLDTFDHLPVTVTFEVAQQQFSIAELKTLFEGHVIPLDKPLTSPIVVHANGKRIASAELVNLNDRLGARITELFATQEMPHD